MNRSLLAAALVVFAPIGGATALAANAAAVAQESNVVLEGTFQGYEGHDGRGTARIVQEGDAYFLEFENFRVDRGPQLRVWVAEGPVTTNADGKAAAYIDLGRLQGARRASQRYELPEDFDLESAKSVVIWCEPFSILFSSADLS